MAGFNFGHKLNNMKVVTILDEKERIKGRSCQYTPTTKEALKLVIDSKLPYSLFQKSASFLTLLLFDEIRSTFVSALSLMK